MASSSFERTFAMRPALSIVVLLASVATPRLAYATSCAIAGSIATAANRATTIVLARVASITPPSARVTENADGSISVALTSTDPHRIDLVIETTFKGLVTGNVTIETPQQFTAGSRYVIYGSEAADRLVVAPCARVRLVSEADGDLTYLAGMRKGVEQGVVYGQLTLVSAFGRALPFSEATIEVSSPDGGRQSFAVGKYGSFEIVLRPGSYLFWVERDGRQANNPERIEITTGDQPKFFSVAARAVDMERGRQISATMIGPISLGMTLADARRAAPNAEFRRRSDGDGAALVEIEFEPNEVLIVWAGEDDPALPIDWTKTIRVIETFSETFSVDGMIAPGSLIAQVVDHWGPVQDIVVSEIEARQFVTFERQPREFTIRLDYTGEFGDGTRHTTRYKPGAKILSIAISK
jgi:hypothetical protein